MTTVEILDRAVGAESLRSRRRPPRVGMIPVQAAEALLRARRGVPLPREARGQAEGVRHRGLLPQDPRVEGALPAAAQALEAVARGVPADNRR